MHCDFMKWRIKATTLTSLYSNSEVSENTLNFLPNRTDLYTVIYLSYVNLTIQLSQFDE